MLQRERTIYVEVNGILTPILFILGSRVSMQDAILCFIGTLRPEIQIGNSFHAVFSWNYLRLLNRYHMEPL